MVTQNWTTVSGHTKLLLIFGFNTKFVLALIPLKLTVTFFYQSKFWIVLFPVIIPLTAIDFNLLFFFFKINYLNFLLRITDIITSKLPKTAAIIIDIIIDALNTMNKTSNQSFSLATLGAMVLGISDAALAETTAAAAKSSVVVVAVVVVVAAVVVESICRC